MVKFIMNKQDLKRILIYLKYLTHIDFKPSKIQERLKKRLTWIYILLIMILLIIIFVKNHKLRLFLSLILWIAILILLLIHDYIGGGFMDWWREREKERIKKIIENEKEKLKEDEKTQIIQMPEMRNNNGQVVDIGSSEIL